MGLASPYIGRASAYREDIGSGKGGHPIERLRDLQVGNPHELTLLAYTTSIPEYRMHRLFRAERIRGEWHRLSAALLREISTWDWLDEEQFRRLRYNTQNARSGRMYS